MEIQLFIVGIILISSGLFIGKAVFKKLKTFGSNSPCDSDCGCGK